MTERLQEINEENASFKAPDRIEVSVGGQEYLLDGSQVSAEVDDPVAGVVATNTDVHETVHSIPNPNNIQKTENIPGSDYLGVTYPISFDPIAAVAPHAMGMSGTGHDLAVTEMMGADIGSAMSAARKIVSKRWKYVEVVAKYLHVKRVLTGGEIQDIMEDVDKGDKVDVTIKRPDGKVQRYPGLRTHEPTVMIPGEWIEMPQAA